MQVIDLEERQTESANDGSCTDVHERLAKHLGDCAGMYVHAHKGKYFFIPETKCKPRPKNGSRYVQTCTSGKNGNFRCHHEKNRRHAPLNCV